MWAAVRRIFGVSFLGLPIRSVIFDVVVAGLFTLLTVPYVLPLSGRTTPGWSAGLVGCGMAVALLARRRWPVAAFTVTCLLGVTQLVVGMQTPAVFDIAVLVAMYSVVKYAGRMLWVWLAAAAVALGALVYGVTVGQHLGLGGGPTWYVRSASIVVYSLPVWLVGLTMRTRRLYVLSLEDRAATAERERDQRARLAVAEERGRIARELHDVVAHSLAVMIVQADGAGYVSRTDPDAARGAIRTVADTGREALADMRRLVAVLRDGDGSGDAGPDVPDEPDEAVAVDPAPAARPAHTGTAGTAAPAHVGPARGSAGAGSGEAAALAGAHERRRVRLGYLTPLLRRFRAAGLSVDLTRTGDVRDLPAGVELAGYRIVQESLTNALKHGGTGTRATVTVGYHGDRVELDVTDDGGGAHRYSAEPLPGGHGLLGMRERVGVFGGSFRAGPRVDTGWRVTATLPVPAVRPVPAGEHR